MNRDAAIFVAGERGLVGSAIVRALRARDFSNLVSAPRTKLDLRDAERQSLVKKHGYKVFDQHE